MARRSLTARSGRSRWRKGGAIRGPWATRSRGATPGLPWATPSLSALPPLVNARERTGSGTPRADGASWRVVTDPGALLLLQGATSAAPRSKPRAQRRLPSRGVGPGWGAPGASPKRSPRSRRARDKSAADAPNLGDCRKSTAQTCNAPALGCGRSAIRSGSLLHYRGRVRPRRRGSLAASPTPARRCWPVAEPSAGWF
jgi:hypothetical protein